MRLLLDTHVLIAAARQELSKTGATVEELLLAPDNISFTSAASLWEIAIKHALGKLDPGIPIGDLPPYFESLGFVALPVTHRHAITAVDPQPQTRDPFDRILLAQCKCENLRLVTSDRALTEHPLAWRP